MTLNSHSLLAEENQLKTPKYKTIPNVASRGHQFHLNRRVFVVAALLGTLVAL